ncbi:MAG: flagellar biosynthesis anti-sigma factor FlgM [Sulfuricurvum sp.]|jgi:anti-sigma28 factor (negative regulator of flagellin synthesis)
MISGLNSTNIKGLYQNDLGVEKKESSQKGSISAQGDKSRVDELKEAIGSGEYKLDLRALSQKIADELLM